MPWDSRQWRMFGFGFPRKNYNCILLPPTSCIASGPTQLCRRDRYLCLALCCLFLIDIWLGQEPRADPCMWLAIIPQARRRRVMSQLHLTAPPQLQATVTFHFVHIPLHTKQTPYIRHTHIKMFRKLFKEVYLNKRINHYP